MPRFGTTGYQWACNDEVCGDGSHGGFDGSRPNIGAEMVKSAKRHAEATGHEVQVDRMQSIWFGAPPVEAGGAG